MIETTQKPGDRRPFVHKRLLRAATGFVTGGPTGALGGFLAPQPVSRAPRRVARTVEKEMARAIKFSATPTPFAPRRGCGILRKRDPITQKCVPIFAGSLPGIDDRTRRAAPGNAVMGRYGAALEPGSQIVDRAVCLRGMVLGNDDLCYNRSQIKNADRMWPRGRRPLLTGGDMRAISTAARAGKRLEGATKRLQKIGLMKKPAPRKAPVARSGPTEHHHHT